MICELRFALHPSADHPSGEYVARRAAIYANRAAMGVDDDERTEFTPAGAMGKRRTYRRSGPVAA
jgi:hypothetical protein